MIQITYRTKRGAGMLKTFPNRKSAEGGLIKLFHRKIEATAKENGREIGQVWKECKKGNRLYKWNWYIETKEATP